MRPSPRVALFLTLSVVGCAKTIDESASSVAEETPSAFCTEALDLLSEENSKSSDPGPLLAQMQGVEAAAESLPPEERSQLRALIDPVVETLEEARHGQAENGWSTTAVADHVHELCGGNPIGWVVQP